MKNKEMWWENVKCLKKVAKGLKEVGRDLLPHTKNGDINKARNDLFTEWAVLEATIDDIEALFKMEEK